MGKKETALTSKIKTFLQSYPKSWIYKTSDSFSFGIPDIIGCINGKFIALEIKKEEYEKEAEANHKARFKLQKHIIKLINEAGGIAYVVYGNKGWKEVQELLIGELDG